MSILWARENSRWQANDLERDDLETIHVDVSVARALNLPFELTPFGKGIDRQFALLLPYGSEAYVNGQKVIAGLHLLDHRDEIHVGKGRWYFSSEAMPQKVAYQHAAGNKRPRCGVCRVTINDGGTVVVCPRCGRLYHQIDGQEDRPEKHCFTFRDRCLCGHPTSLNGEDIWRPSEEVLQ